jgi:hypothetical protein
MRVDCGHEEESRPHRRTVKLPAQRAGLLKVNGNGSRVTKAEPESTS